MLKEPLISIITPCYNSEKYIAEAIESVLAQTYKNWEMIIIDDYSSDNSLDIVNTYAQKDGRIKVVRQERNSGAAAARNRGIDISKGEYLAFLDSDDLWLSEKLEKQLRFMQKYNCDFSFTERELIDEMGNPLRVKTRVIKKLTYKRNLFHCFTGCSATIYKQDINNRIYGPDLKNCDDYALFLRVLRCTRNAMGYNENLSKYRIVKGSLSRNKFKKFPYFIEMMTKYEKQNIFAAYFYLFTNQIIKLFWKYKKVQKLLP
ncbi:MAG: glycosyltransferase [Chitinispirillales bacterium]|jgi:glycosyltransferase involved in cell wall biosynthesis|nr:glycosyltransferase [Chitinispirillales bacterium]